MSEKTEPFFKYWWADAGSRVVNGREESFPLAFYGMPTPGGYSDVTAETLETRGFAVPETPSFWEWTIETRDKRRCPKCYAALRGTASDWAYHSVVVHHAKPEAVA